MHSTNMTPKALSRKDIKTLCVTYDQEENPQFSFDVDKIGSHLTKIINDNH